MSISSPLLTLSRVYCLIEVIIRLRWTLAKRLDQPLVEERPDMDKEHEDEQDDPSGESACSTVDLFKIEQQTYDE